MDSASIRRQARTLEIARRVDWGATAVWLLCFGLIALLGLEGGGYDPLVHDQVGIAVFWILLAGVLVGALPRARPGALAWSALALLAAFVLWTALSLIWTESGEKTAADVARVCGYAGIFALGVFTRAPREAGRLLGAVAAAIVVISTIALLSRLHPVWFPEAHQTVRFLSDSRERLSYPLNYWNGLAGLIAIGLPLVFHAATWGKSIVLRAAAAAALPAMGLTIYLTLSRGGIVAALLALALLLALTPDRLPKFLTALLAGAGAAVLIAATNQRDSLQHGLLNATARHQGNAVLALTAVVCGVVGLLQAGLSWAVIGQLRPRWSLVSRRQALWASVLGLAALLAVAVALDAPGRASNGWNEFKQGGHPGKGTERLGSVAGESRYQFWSAAVRENATQPLLGTGSGTFQFWWPRAGTNSSVVRDTHSLYLQTLGELGIVGLLLLAGFLLVVLIGGARAAVLAPIEERSPLAAALAGCLAFCVTAAVDWMWQIPVLPAAFLLLASVLVTGQLARGASHSPLRLPLRLGFGGVALIAIALIAIPLASTSLVRQSQADARAGNVSAALSEARSAQNVEPWAATPRLQQALVLEEGGRLAPAAAAARAATQRESTNWRTWLVLSRIEAERGRVASAVSAYEKARSLNPRSELFRR